MSLVRRSSAMMASAELRWFWKDEPPRKITDWFHAGDVRAGGGSALRRDRYFPRGGEPELGVKMRDEGGEKAQVEIKGLVATLPPPDLELDVRRLEIWCKWRTSVRPTGPGLLLEKQRWLRKFAADLGEIPLTKDEQPEPGRELPAAGCNVELTKVVLPDPGDTWWTLGFEAFGDLDRVGGLLTRTLRTRGPPSADPAAELSYPAWLKTYYGGFC